MRDVTQAGTEITVPTTETGALKWGDHELACAVQLAWADGVQYPLIPMIVARRAMEALPMRHQKLIYLMLHGARGATMRALMDMGEQSLRGLRAYVPRSYRARLWDELERYTKERERGEATATAPPR